MEVLGSICLLARKLHGDSQPIFGQPLRTTPSGNSFGVLVPLERFSAPGEGADGVTVVKSQRVLFHEKPLP